MAVMGKSRPGRVAAVTFVTALMVISFVFAKGQKGESFVPRDLMEGSQKVQGRNSFTISFPFSKMLSLRLFRDYVPPPKRTPRRPKLRIGTTIFGGSAHLDLGEFQVHSTALQSGAVLPPSLPSPGTEKRVPSFLVAPSLLTRFRSPSAFDAFDPQPLTLWRGRFRHQNIRYESRDGRFRTSVHFAEADPHFLSPTPSFAKMLEGETDLFFPLNAFLGAQAKQWETRWHPDKKTTVQSFFSEVRGHKGGIVKGQALRLGTYRLNLQWSKLKATETHRLSKATGEAQSRLVPRLFGKSAPLKLGDWRLWRDLDHESFQATYRANGFQAQIRRRSLSGTGGALKGYAFRLALNDGRFAWERGRDKVAKGTKPKALKALGLSSLLPRIGWEHRFDKFTLKFSGKDSLQHKKTLWKNGAAMVRRETTSLTLLEARLTLNRSEQSIARISPSFLKAIGMSKESPKIGWLFRDEGIRWKFNKEDIFSFTRSRYKDGRILLERQMKKLSLFRGKLLWDEEGERLSEGVDLKFLKAIGWSKVKPRLGWNSLRRRIQLQITPKERLIFRHFRHARGNALVERHQLIAELDGGRFRWEQTHDRVDPAVKPGQLKALGLSEMAPDRGWSETRYRLSWKLSPRLSLTYTHSKGKARPGAPHPFQTRRRKEALLKINRKGMNITLALGKWRLIPKDRQGKPLIGRSIRWQSVQTLPFLGGLQLTLQRHLTETRRGEKEQDTRFTRTALKTVGKGRVQLFAERVTQEATGKRRKERLHTRLSVRFSPGWRLTMEMKKQPRKGAPLLTHRRTLTYQPHPNLQITTTMSKTKVGPTKRRETVATVTSGSTQNRHEIKVVRFETDSPAKTDIKGWRLQWGWTVPQRLALVASWGVLRREDKRKGHEERLAVALPSKKGKGIAFRFGYWRLSLLDEVMGRQKARELMKVAQKASRPVPQAGTPSLSILSPKAEGYRTVWVVASRKGQWHLGLQLGQAEGKGVKEHRVYLEIPAVKKRPIALRFGYWKLRPWSGKGREIPSWRLVLPLNEGKLVWGMAYYRDRKGEVTMREFAFVLPLDKRGSRLTLTNFTNMPARWEKQWHRKDWMRFTGDLALAPQLLVTRKGLALYKLHRASLKFQLWKGWKLIGRWEEQIGVPKRPITHDWHFALEWTPQSNIRWRFEWAKLKNDGKEPMRTDLFEISYRYRLSDARFVTLQMRWMENPRLSRPGFISDRWLASLSLSQRW